LCGTENFVIVVTCHFCGKLTAVALMFIHRIELSSTELHEMFWLCDTIQDYLD